MYFLAVGINHKTAPISIREKFYLNDTQQELLLSELKNEVSVVEAFVLSTCNRTEVYLHVISEGCDTFDIVRKICAIKDIEFNSGLMGYFYALAGQKSIEHLLRVTTGLDSLVLGEKQIIGQVRKSFELARRKGLFAKTFNILSNIVLRAGKKARHETHIDVGGSSVSWAAMEMAEEKLGSLHEKTVLIIGAGQMSKLAVGQLSNRTFKKVYLMNRTQKHAEELAKTVQGEIAPFCDMKEVLAQVDLCICASSAPHYILDAPVVEKALNLRKEEGHLLFIDISMPRNIDPHINTLPNVDLYCIDDFQQIVSKNMKRRETAIKEVEQIIEDKVQALKSKLTFNETDLWKDSLEYSTL